jgi:hypothetical protein
MPKGPKGERRPADEAVRASPEGEHRYSLAECIGTRKQKITGRPGRKQVSTSYNRAFKSHHANEHAEICQIDECA